MLLQNPEGLLFGEAATRSVRLLPGDGTYFILETFSRINSRPVVEGCKGQAKQSPPFRAHHNLGNFMRTLALPKEEVEHRTLTTLREKLVKIGAKVEPFR